MDRCKVVKLRLVSDLCGSSYVGSEGAVAPIRYLHGEE